VGTLGEGLAHEPLRLGEIDVHFPQLSLHLDGGNADRGTFRGRTKLCGRAEPKAPEHHQRQNRNANVHQGTWDAVFETG